MKYALSQNTGIQFRVRMLLSWLWYFKEEVTAASSKKTRRQNTTYINSKRKQHYYLMLCKALQKHFEHWHITLYFMRLCMPTTLRMFLFPFTPTSERFVLLKIHEARNALLHLLEKYWEQQDNTQVKGHSIHALLYHTNGRWYLQLEEQRGSLEG